MNPEHWYPSNDVRSKLCPEDFKRANVIKEIYKTENDYLGHLKNLVDVNLKKRIFFFQVEKRLSILGLFKENAFT